MGKSNGSSLDAIPRGGELDLLTAVRFFAAMWVVVHHLGLWKMDEGSMASTITHRFLEHGSIGVKFFFVLSGFILTHVYGRREKIPFREFLTARFARIYPVYLFALLVGIPMLVAGCRELVAKHSMAVGIGLAASKTVMVLTLTQAWYASSALFWNGVSWSLSAEAFFYVLFPFILPRLRGRSTAMLFGVLMGCMVLEAGRSIGVSTLPSDAWGFFPPLRIADFITGIVLRLLVDRNLRPPAWSAIPALFCFFAIQIPPLNSVLSWLGFALAGHAAIGWSIAALASPRRGADPSPWMRVPILLGQVSYSIYLLHYPLFTYWMLIFPGQLDRTFGWYLLCLICICTAVYFLVESPAREKIRSWAKPQAQLRT